MLRVMQAETYKTSRRKYTYIFIGLCLAAMVLITALASMNDHVTYAQYIELIMHMVQIIGLLTFFVAQIVFSDEYRNGTIKNVAAMGTNRVSYYFGKLAVQILLGIVMYVGIYAFGLLLGNLFFPVKGEVGPMLTLFFNRFLTSLPLLIGLISMANMVCFTIKNSVAGASIFLVAYLLLPNILLLLGQLISEDALKLMQDVVKFLSSYQLGEIGSAMTITNGMVMNSLLLGGAYLVGGTAIGLAGFVKRELQ